MALEEETFEGNGEESLDFVWQDFANIAADPPKKREICPHCERPYTVCYCDEITPIPLRTSHHLLILQHPNELKRCLRTTKILELALPATHFEIYRGKKFHPKKYPELHTRLTERPTLLLYPSASARPLSEFAESLRDRPHNILMLDGTWSQARLLLNANEFLRELPCVKIDPGEERSQYVIRTQPTECCLSTVEAAGLVLSQLEDDKSIVEKLGKPLRRICEFQLGKGAVQHQSKEYLITNGLYDKPLNKRIQKQLEMNRELKDMIHLLDR